MADPLAPLRAALMSDPAIQRHLAQHVDRAAFVAALGDWAQARGIIVDAAALAVAVAPDPLGLDRHAAAPHGGRDWPPEAWLPAHVAPDGSVQWLHFAGTPLDAPFYEETVRRVGSRPFARLMRYGTPLADFVAGAPEGGIVPAGLIFHMSRCGSTLAAQMLAAVPGHVVASEPAPLDAIVQLPFAGYPLTAHDHAMALRAMAAALGRQARAAGGRFFIKLDAWHALALPLFRLAFPGVPFAFLYRDPVEVLVSLTRMPGLHSLPGALPPALFGIPPEAAVHGVDFAARTIGAICAAAASDPALLLIDYGELPQAVGTRLLPHFGIVLDPAGAEAMASASRRDAKTPNMDFTPDREAKQQEAGAELRAAASMHIAPHWRCLAQRRAGQG